MDRPLTLTALSEPRVSLRAAGPGDLDELRVWKNANKTSFFFQGEITPAMQSEWYEGYRKRPDDFMFIVEHEDAKAGCMGFRLLESGAADTYNMIAASEAKGKGLMKAAMLVMCSHIAARHTKDIGCLVMKGNPAVSYYEHCGYKVVGEADDHHILKLDWTRSSPIPYETN